MYEFLSIMRVHYHPLVFLHHAGNHTVEERGRGEEEHVPSGRHRLAEVRGLRRFRECTGAGCEGGERVEPPPPHSRLISVCVGVSEIPVNCATSGEAAVFTCSRCWDEEGRPTCSNAVCEQWNSLHEAFEVASGCWSCRFSLTHLFFFLPGNQITHLSHCPL